MAVFSSRQVFLVVMLILTFFKLEINSSIIEEDDTIRLKRSTKIKSCIEVWSKCRKNSSCHASYRTVKRKCTADVNVCHADPKFLMQCAIEIGLLQTSTFKEGCNCFSINYSDVKQIMKCTEIHNTIFANPCYDHGQAALEEERLLGAVTMRAAVATETDDVTENYDGNTSVDLSLMKTEEHVTAAQRDYVHADDVATKRVVDMTKEKPENKINNHRQINQNYKLTEEDYRKLDELFAMDYERYSDQEQPNIETSGRQSEPDDVKNSVSNEIYNTTTYLKESLSHGNDRERLGNYTSILTIEKHFGDDNHKAAQQKSLVTDANTFRDVTQAAYDLIHNAKQSNMDAIFYNSTAKTEETLLTTDQLVRYKLEANMTGDKVVQQLSTLQIALIVIGFILLVVAILGVFMLSKKRKRNQYLPGMLFKKSCQSAIIVKVVYEDNDTKLRKKTDHV